MAANRLGAHGITTRIVLFTLRAPLQATNGPLAQALCQAILPFPSEAIARTEPGIR